MPFSRREMFVISRDSDIIDDKTLKSRSEFPVKKTLTVFTFVSIALFLFSLAPTTVDGAESLPLNYDLTTAVKLSKILDRHLMFTFVSSGCSHCTTFKEDVVSAPSVKEILNDHFVFSLVSFDESFTVTLPEKGEISNLQLASALGVRGTPATYFFYPPDPGLAGRGILSVPGVLSCEYVPYYSDAADQLLNLSEFCSSDEAAKKSYEENVGITLWALKQIGTLSPKGEGEDNEFLNYQDPKKNISPEELQLLVNNTFPLPIVESVEGVKELEDPKEVILDSTGEDKSGEEVADAILADTDVRKVFIVTKGEESSEDSSQ